jgi:hypothetical protein
MQVTTSPPVVDRRYAYSLYSSVRPPQRIRPPDEIPLPWLVFESEALWEKWLELRQKWAGDVGAWK